MSAAGGLDVTEFTVEDVQAGLARGQFSCEALTRAFLARIDAYDGSYNAIIFRNGEAIADAQAIDRRRAAGETLGPLAGVPVVVKDAMDMRGFPTTGGWRLLHAPMGGVDLFPATDAPVVARLRAAGTIILGKTNIPVLSRTGSHANDSWAGPTYNAAARALLPGGSSAGTATAVAASFAVLGLAEETGGSIQNPASAQALVGIKPTFGLVPNAGVLPLSSLRDVVGPIARCVRDAALTLDVLAGFTTEDPKTAAAFGCVPAAGYAASLLPDGLRGKRMVLEDVAFTAQAGAVTAVLGEAGAGKTSLLAAAAGLLKLERGAVLRDGDDVSRLPPRRRGVSLLAPGSALPDAMTVQAALRRMAGRAALARLATVVDALGLGALAQTEVGTLSHGNALLALTAARLARAGDVLLVDEAGAGLDLAAADRLMAVLRRRAEEGCTVLLATRTARVALAADHLVLLGDGRVLQTGTPASLYAEPRDAACAVLTGHANILAGHIRELRPGGFIWSGGGRFLQAAAADAPRPTLGCPVSFCLRPERVALLGEGVEADNLQEGTVRSVVSAGGHLHVRVSAPLGELLAVVPSWPHPGVSKGQTIRIGWHAAACHILTA